MHMSEEYMSKEEELFLGISTQLELMNLVKLGKSQLEFQII